MLKIFIIPIVLLGIYTSYTDIKVGKIKNKGILAALLYPATIYLIITLYLILGKVELNTLFLLETFINFLISSLIGFFLWYFGLWHAGDGKLFTTLTPNLSSVRPRLQPSIHTLGYAPSATSCSVGHTGLTTSPVR